MDERIREVQYLSPKLWWQGFAESAFPIAPNGCPGGDIIHCRQPSAVQPRVDETHRWLVLCNKSSVDLAYHSRPDRRGRTVERVLLATLPSHIQPLIEQDRGDTYLVPAKPTRTLPWSANVALKLCALTSGNPRPDALNRPWNWLPIVPLRYGGTALSW